LPWDLVFSEGIEVSEDARGTRIPEEVVELWFSSQLVGSSHDRDKESSDLVSSRIDRVHVDLITTVASPESDEILIRSDHIDELELVHQSGQYLEARPSLLAYLG
jgi:hypothetical protein